MQRLLVSLALTTLVGCDRERTPPATATVHGVVTINGKTPGKLLLVLTPELPGVGREEECVVEGGKYQATILAARYRVAFSPIVGGVVVPRKYQEASTSGFVLEATQDTTCDFALKSGS